VRYTKKEVKRRIKRANQIADRLEAIRARGLSGKRRKARRQLKRELVRLVYPLIKRGLW
jgi:hypothetical protein